MRLNARATVRSSAGPFSGSRAGVSPRPTRRAARVSASSERLMPEATSQAPTKAMAITSAAHPM
jgi:hypothetical protein